MNTTLSFEGGKYELSRDSSGLLRAKRYGEPWREEVAHDKMIDSLFDFAQDQRELNRRLLQAITDAAEAMGMIDKGEGSLSISQCLMLLGDLTRPASQSREEKVADEATHHGAPKSKPQLRFRQ